LLFQQIRYAGLKKDDGVKCRQGSASDRAASGPDVGLKADVENKAKTAASWPTDSGTKSPPARHAENAPSELASERMWEDISDASETSEFSDLSPQPATTKVTVVGNGLIQVSPADPLLRGFSLGSTDESRMSTGGNWKNGDGLYKRRCLWESCDEVVGQQEWERSVEDLGDDNGHPRRLVQLQNILPLFVFGTNSDGSRSVQLAVIGDRKLNSEYLLSPRTAQSVHVTASYAAEAANNLPRNNNLLPKSTSR